MAALQNYLQHAVIYEDSQMLAFNKPAGVPVHGGGHDLPHIDGALNGQVRAGRTTTSVFLVHRLDMDTSGVLLLAKTTCAARRLSKAFSRRAVQKEYWAVTVGQPANPTGTIALPIAQQAEQSNLMMVAPEGKPAFTQYETIGLLGGNLALVALMPRTGRTHQLRVHMSATGTPILGDPKYGTHVNATDKMLHLLARQLTVPHEQDGIVTISAPHPQHFSETFSQYGFNPLTKSGISQGNHARSSSFLKISPP